MSHQASSRPSQLVTTPVLRKYLLSLVLLPHLPSQSNWSSMQATCRFTDVFKCSLCCRNLTSESGVMKDSKSDRSLLLTNPIPALNFSPAILHLLPTSLLEDCFLVSLDSAASNLFLRFSRFSCLILNTSSADDTSIIIICIFSLRSSISSSQSLLLSTHLTSLSSSVVLSFTIIVNYSTWVMKFNCLDETWETSSCYCFCLWLLSPGPAGQLSRPKYSSKLKLLCPSLLSRSEMFSFHGQLILWIHLTYLVCSDSPPINTFSFLPKFWCDQMCWKFGKVIEMMHNKWCFWANKDSRQCCCIIIIFWGLAWSLVSTWLTLCYQAVRPVSVCYQSSPQQGLEEKHRKIQSTLNGLNYQWPWSSILDSMRTFIWTWTLSGLQIKDTAQ